MVTTSSSVVLWYKSLCPVYIIELSRDVNETLFVVFTVKIESNFNQKI